MNRGLILQKTSSLSSLDSQSLPTPYFSQSLMSVLEKRCENPLNSSGEDHPF